jgi:hypothetical protein
MGSLVRNGVGVIEIVASNNEKKEKRKIETKD